MSSYTIDENPNTKDRDSLPVCVFESGNSSPIKCFASNEDASGYIEYLESLKPKPLKP